MANQHIATYLQDHLAGSVVALELLDYLEKAHTGTSLERFLARLREDINADRDDLVSLMDRLEVSTGTVRSAVAWIAEKATRLKLRLDDAIGGDFRLLEAVELVATGIEGKRSLWVALSEVSADNPQLRGPDYTRLIERAVEQRERIERVRLDAARVALGSRRDGPIMGDI